MHLDGAREQDLWITTLRLANTGNSAVRVEDFSEPLRFSTDGVVVEGIISSTAADQSDPTPQISQADKGTEFIVEPFPLDKRQSVTFLILSKEELLRIRPPAPVPIKNVRTIDIVPRSSNIESEQGMNLFDRITNLLAGVMSALVAAVSLIALTQSKRASSSASLRG